MCSFTVLGGSRGGVRKPVSIWCDHICLNQCNTYPSHRVDQVVECWSTPLQWLCDVAGYWQELEHAVVYADSEHPKHAQWVTCPWVCWPCKNWDVFSFQELWTDPCNMGPCIIMLQHEVMVVDEWHNNGLRISSRYLWALKCPIKCTSVRCP